MTANAFVESGFIALPLAVAVVVAWASGSLRVTVAIAVWTMFVAWLGWTGVLTRFGANPPPIALVFMTGFGLTIYFGRSHAARRLVGLPLSWLIGFHGFRIGVEFFIHSACAIGLAPPQMTWDGLNFDIVTGVTAVAIAPFAHKISRTWIFVWNCLGLGLLIWVVLVAIVSMPTRIQLLRPDNTWIASFPFVWLPSVLVTAALLGHILIFRKLESVER